MKIFYSLPENMDKGDIYILGIVRVGVIGFLMISSLTVFAGFRSYSSAYLNSLFPILAWLLLFLGYWAFCFVPDFVNTMIVRYISRTILKKTYAGDPRTMFVLLASAGLVFLLTRYSYKMSQFSADKTGREMGGEIQRTDLVAFDSTYMFRFEKLQSDYEKEKEEIITRYDRLVEEAAGELNFKIKGEETLIAGMEQNRKKSNTIWTDQQIRIHQRRIADYEKRKKPLISPIRQEQQAELRALKDRTDEKQSLLAESYTITRDTTLSIEGAAGHTHQSEVSFFSKQLAGISGNAIFILIILTIVREIIYDRNEIDPDPVFSPSDFQPSIIIEVAAYPFAWMGRRMINWVRMGYNNLPELIERDDFRELQDPGQRQKVLKAKNEENTETEKTKSTENQKRPEEKKTERQKDEKPETSEMKTSETEVEEKPETPETENDEITGIAETETTEITETKKDEKTERQKRPKPENTETPEYPYLRKREKPEYSNKDRRSGRKPISVNRGQKRDEITEIEKGKDGNILKVRIGHKWYTYYELGKRLYDFRHLAKNATKESTRERNLHKIEVFERARRLFENTENTETQKNGNMSREEKIEFLTNRLNEAVKARLAPDIIQGIEESLRELGVEPIKVSQ